MASSKLNPAQLQMYQQRQALLRQQQIKAAALQGQVQGRTTVALTSPTQARIQQVSAATVNCRLLAFTKQQVFTMCLKIITSVQNDLIHTIFLKESEITFGMDNQIRNMFSIFPF